MVVEALDVGRRPNAGHGLVEFHHLLADGAEGLHHQGQSILMVIEKKNNEDNRWTNLGRHGRFDLPGGEVRLDHVAEQGHQFVLDLGDVVVVVLRTTRVQWQRIRSRTMSKKKVRWDRICLRV